MKFTYANVMSTVAMFAAVTTGTSFAAIQLGANSVGSVQIRNDQIRFSDLHPTVRAKIGIPTLDSSAPTSIGTAWTNVPVVKNDEPVFQCQMADCPDQYTAKQGYIGQLSMANAGLALPATGNVRFRLTGSLTNGGNFPMSTLIQIRTSSTLTGLSEPSSKIIHCSSDPYGDAGPMPQGSTKQLLCPIGTVTAAGAKFVKLDLIAISYAQPNPSSASGLFNGQLRLEVQKA